MFTGGTLEITVEEHDENDQELLKWFDTADDKAELIVQALINENGIVTKVSQLKHQFGTASWDGQKITWNLGEDDRMNMQVNPWNFDSDALTG
jgi:hypothetical protein